MKQTKLTRLFSAVLATMMLVAPGGIHASANQGSSTGTGSQSASLAEMLSTVSYVEYLEKNAGTPAGTQSVSISGDQITSFNKEKTDTEKTAAVEVDGKKGLYLPAEGIVGWDIEVPAAGMYQVNIEYSAVVSDTSKTTSIERTMYINSKIPFYEARFLTLAKTWVDNTGSYQDDSNGNIIYKYMKDGENTYPYVDVDGNVLELKIEDNKMVFKKTGEKVDESKLNGAFKYPVYQNDINGNEIKADKLVHTVGTAEILGETMSIGDISKYIATDSTGYQLDALQFAFNEGTNTIQLEAQREEMIIYSIELVPYTKYISYEEYVAQHKAAGAADVTDAGELKIQAEYPTASSENTIYATNDRTSYISEPQDATSLLMNAIGGDGGEKWQNIGQWVRYTIENVPKSGFYQISLRFKQSVLEGTFSSRTMRVATQSMINEGKPATVPFYEAQYLQFNYSDDWQVETLNNGTTTYMVYLEEGTNVLEFEASLGNMAAILDTVENAMTTVNEIYIKLLMITGADPDANRDYGFYRIMPDEVDELLRQAQVLYGVAADFEKQVGAAGSHAKTLETVAKLLERMGGDEDEIAANMGSLKENLGTLGTWLQTSKNQPLEIDYIVVQPVGAELPPANDSFWETIVFEVTQFFMSFVADYNTLGSTEIVDDENVVQVWTTLGRDQAQIIRNLINSDFNKNNPGVSVELKLVAGGSLLPSVLAGVGPDVSMGHGTGDVINWAIRSAVAPLNDMPDLEKYVGTYDPVEGFSGGHFDENGAWMGDAYFTKAAIEPLTLFAEYEDGTQEALLFGIPETQSFSMLFYRADIFNDLGLEVPNTWDDMVAILPVLQNNNMQVAMPKELGGLNLFLYQMGGDLYADNGKRVGLDSDLALQAFDYMCSFFSKYRCPKDYDFANRFRTGEIPIGIMDYGTYTQLSVYATEIKGLWEFVPLPGWETYNEDGTVSVNKSSLSGTSALIMLADENRTREQTENAWKYMTWYVGAENQSNYANELTALLGTVSKHSTANVEALTSLSWSTSEANNLMEQFRELEAVREYPGGYIITRYVSFAFLSVYNDNADPTDSILSYIVEINKEITRKRQEFDMTYYEITYSTSFIEEGEET